MLDNFGIIFHVGLYSYYGYDDIKSSRKRKLQNGSEWYLERLQPNKFRPVSGSTQTQEYHKHVYNDSDYYGAKICINRESIRHWIHICKQSGATYVVITAKHHDGFCLWNTETTNNKHSENILLIFKEETIRAGLKFGIYYSWYEFLRKSTVSYFNEICIPQVTELYTQYNPDYMWFDGDWPFKQKIVMTSIAQLIRNMREQNPHILINDRIGKGCSELASYQVGNDRHIPESKQTSSWQHINTIGLSWGYNKMQEPIDYKTGRDLYKLYEKVIELGGTLLLNLGPDHNGNLDPREVESLSSFSSLVHNNLNM